MLLSSTRFSQVASTDQGAASTPGSSSQHQAQDDLTYQAWNIQAKITGLLFMLIFGLISIAFLATGHIGESVAFLLMSLCAMALLVFSIYDKQRLAKTANIPTQKRSR